LYDTPFSASWLFRTRLLSAGQSGFFMRENER
jgi:hypothetical protein